MTDAETSVARLREGVLEFRDQRDWKQFHNPKDLAVALAIEVAELMEHFRFKDAQQIARELEGGAPPELAHELADVLYFVLLLSDELGVDLTGALREKMALSAQRYPVERSRGRNLKYDQL